MQQAEGAGELLVAAHRIVCSTAIRKLSPMVTGTKKKWKMLVDANWSRARSSAVMATLLRPHGAELDSNDLCEYRSAPFDLCTCDLGSIPSALAAICS
jgi:hypothetical protein